eukprot:TRINITY_DN8311_c0_g1_i2.p1 TRINITY_DN8311_c0_g1~~TRINITY_DN8311_c0_g1_i2.p1  ORF type:complete len:209 (-),score=13.29 TRINITY_DN8311_c0_g1_i2:194-820(-)
MYFSGVMEYRIRAPKTFYLYKIFLAYGIIGSMTWLFSFLFHCRDTKITELLDYVFASFTFFFGSFWTTLRIFEIRKSSHMIGVFFFFLIWCIQHWYYMLSVNYDYDYNMTVGVTNGIYQSIAWILWYLVNRAEPARKHYTHKILYVYGFLWIAALMELFDFPPFWDVLDPHSLWHLGTIPLGYLLWKFLVDDSIHEEECMMSRRYHLG